MKIDVRELKAVGIDMESVKAYTKGKEGYLSALRMYCRAYSANKENMDNYFAKEDWENYTIIVHSLKSNSRMIGALALGDEFERLEMAGRKLDLDTIKKYNYETSIHYKRIVEFLEPRVKADEGAAADALSAEQAGQIMEALLEALDDFDDDQSAALAAKLSGYPFPEEKRGLVGQAEDYIKDFMYDEAADLIRELQACL